MKEPPRVVPRVVAELSARLVASFKRQIVGIYLGGSLSMGDFEPKTSDYDLLIVTERALSTEQLAIVDHLHRRLLEEYSEAARLEGDYAPRELLVSQGTLAPVPGIRHGIFVPRTPEIMLSADNIANMRRQGIAVWGPPAQEVLPEVTAEDVRASVVAMLRDTPEQVETEYQAAEEILNIARSLCALEAGEPITKSQGAEWAMVHVDARWHEAIEQAMALRRGRTLATASDRLLREALSEMVCSLGLQTYCWPPHG